MKKALRTLIFLVGTTAVVLALSGCSSSGGGSYGSSVYYGGGYYDPWYHDNYYPGGVIIGPEYPDIDMPIAMPMDMPMDMGGFDDF